MLTTEQILDMIDWSLFEVKLSGHIRTREKVYSFREKLADEYACPLQILTQKESGFLQGFVDMFAFKPEDFKTVIKIAGHIMNAADKTDEEYWETRQSMLKRMGIKPE